MTGPFSRCISIPVIPGSRIRTLLDILDELLILGLVLAILGYGLTDGCK